jgi:hypothetical protein
MSNFAGPVGGIDCSDEVGPDDVSVTVASEPDAGAREVSSTTPFSLLEVVLEVVLDGKAPALVDCEKADEETPDGTEVAVGVGLCIASAPPSLATVQVAVSEHV